MEDQEILTSELTIRKQLSITSSPPPQLLQGYQMCRPSPTLIKNTKDHFGINGCTDPRESDTAPDLTPTS